jgi:hypothetical protein
MWNGVTGAAASSRMRRSRSARVPNPVYSCSAMTRWLRRRSARLRASAGDGREMLWRFSIVLPTITRFRSPDKLVCYFGLNPRVRQSGGQQASHGRITKAGPGHARGMLVEAAWAAAKTRDPLRAFYQRVRARHGMQIAVVATARKLAVPCWLLLIKGEDYAFAQPSLLAHKHRRLELRAGLPPANGRKGNASGYSLKTVRAAERDLAAQGEAAYRTMVAAWQPTRPASKTPTRKKVACASPLSVETSALRRSADGTGTSEVR